MPNSEQYETSIHQAHTTEAVQHYMHLRTATSEPRKVCADRVIKEHSDDTLRSPVSLPKSVSQQTRARSHLVVHSASEIQNVAKHRPNTHTHTRMCVCAVCLMANA